MDASNGNGKHVTLEEVREQRKLLRAQIGLKKLQREQKLLEHLALWDDDFEWGSPGWWQNSFRDGQGGPWIPISVPSDRRHGQDRLVIENEFQLDVLRQRSRALCKGNGNATGLLGNLCNYVIGKGFAYKAQSKKLVDVSPDQPGNQEAGRIKKLVAEVQDFVDQTLRLNRWNGLTDPRSRRIATDTREQECFRRVLRDGEALLRGYPKDDGTIEFRFMEPEQLRQPPGATIEDGWSWGIRHRMEPFEDVETPEEYHFVWMDQATEDGEGEKVDAKDVLHIRCPGTDANVKRGTPVFAFDVAESLERAAKLQKYLSIASTIRAATAEVWKNAFGTQAEIQDLRAQFKEYDRTDPYTGQSETVERVRPGAIRDLPAGREPVPMPATTGVPEYLQAAQGDRRQAASAFSMPEFMVSSDASNADYSSTKEAGAPFVKAGETWQEFFKSAYLRVIWWAIEWAVECGVLPEEVFDLIDIQVDGPAVLHRNELEAAQVRQIERANGVLSPQTWAAETGRDYELEQANLDEWTERNGQQAPPLDQGDGIQGMGAPAPPLPGGAGPAASPFGESLAECGGEGGKPGPCPQGGEAKRASGKGEHKEAVRALRDAHPFPGRYPEVPDYTGLDEPARDAVWKQHMADVERHAGAYHRAFAAATIDQLLHEPAPKPLPIPTDGKPSRALIRRAKERLRVAEEQRHALSDALAPHVQAVASSHPGGAAALAAAREVAQQRYEQASAQFRRYKGE